jgi:hypothetical protein
MVDVKALENQLHQARRARIDALAAIGDVEEMLGEMRQPIRNVPLPGLARPTFDAPVLSLVSRAA